jgi:WD40 repeat protein
MRLADIEHDSYAELVFVSEDNTIYVAGYIDKAVTLWKIRDNEVSEFSLAKPQRYYSELKVAYITSEPYVNSLFVSSNGDAYVAGRWVGLGPFAMIWKISGTEITMPDLEQVNEFEFSDAYSVYVTPDGDVYVAGYLVTYGRQWFASLWVNGTLHTLSEEEQNAEAYGVHVTGKGDVYIAGKAYIAGRTTAVIWKNRVPEPLSESS